MSVEAHARLLQGLDAKDRERLLRVAAEYGIKGDDPAWVVLALTERGLIGIERGQAGIERAVARLESNAAIPTAQRQILPHHVLWSLWFVGFWLFGFASGVFYSWLRG